MISDDIIICCFFMCLWSESRPVRQFFPIRVHQLATDQYKLRCSNWLSTYIPHRVGTACIYLYATDGLATKVLHWNNIEHGLCRLKTQYKAYLWSWVGHRIRRMPSTETWRTPAGTCSSSLRDASNVRPCGQLEVKSTCAVAHLGILAWHSSLPYQKPCWNRGS